MIYFFYIKWVVKIRSLCWSPRFQTVTKPTKIFRELKWMISHLVLVRWLSTEDHLKIHKNRSQKCSSSSSLNPTMFFPQRWQKTQAWPRGRRGLKQQRYAWRSASPPPPSPSASRSSGCAGETLNSIPILYRGLMVRAPYKYLLLCWGTSFNLWNVKLGCRVV